MTDCNKVDCQYFNKVDYHPRRIQYIGKFSVHFPRENERGIRCTLETDQGFDFSEFAPLIDKNQCTFVEILGNPYNKNKVVIDFNILNNKENILSLCLSTDNVTYVIDGLLSLKNLKILSLYSGSKLKLDYTKFDNLDQLLIDYDNKNKSWLDCSRLRQLQVVNLGSNKNLELFHNLKSLMMLEIVKGRFTSFAGLEKLPNLIALSLTGCNYIENYADLAKFKNIKYLRIQNLKQKLDCSFITEMKQLKWLYLDPFKVSYKEAHLLPNLIEYIGAECRELPKEILASRENQLCPFERHFGSPGFNLYPEDHPDPTQGWVFRKMPEGVS